MKKTASLLAQRVFLNNPVCVCYVSFTCMQWLVTKRPALIFFISLGTDKKRAQMVMVGNTTD